MPEVIDFNKVNGVYKDMSEGDVDFFTYWYSICFVAGMMNEFRKIFRDVESYDMILRRFLQSREIAFKNASTHELLIYIYENWEQIIEKRGTRLVNTFKGQSLEVGVPEILSLATDSAGIETVASGVWEFTLGSFPNPGGICHSTQSWASWQDFMTFPHINFTDKAGYNWKSTILPTGVGRQLIFKLVNVNNPWNFCYFSSTGQTIYSTWMEVQFGNVLGMFLGTPVVGDNYRLTISVPVTPTNTTLTYNESENYDAAYTQRMSGLGIVSNGKGLTAVLPSVINIGTQHILQFDVVLAKEETGVYEGYWVLFDNTHNLPSEVDYFTFEYNSQAQGENMYTYKLDYVCDGEHNIFNITVDVTQMHTIKLVRNSMTLFLYIDGIYEGDIEFTSDNDFGFYTLLSGQDGPALANITVIEKDEFFNNVAVYTWLCNEGAGFTLEGNRAPENSAELNIESTTAWDDSWRRDYRFANTNYQGIDGELRQLLNYSDGECLNELISTAEMGWTMDISSPLSEEASCQNLNKAYEKGVIKHLSQFPLSFESDLKPYIEDEFIRYQIPGCTEATKVWRGINASLASLINWKELISYKPQGAIPFIPIPVYANYSTIQGRANDLDGYEISFVIKSEGEIDLKFGVIALDKDLNNVFNSSKIYSTGLFSDFFLNEIGFDKCVNQELWVRAVWSTSHLTEVAHKLNINIGNNLYTNTVGVVKYVVPFITFTITDNTEKGVMVKDIVLRPLTLNTSKGVTANKNKIISYLRNDSGALNEKIVNFIDQKLIPYNCTANIKFL